MLNAIKLREIITDKKISASKLADIIGLSRQAMSRKINGKKDFKIWEIKSIAKHLDLNWEQVRDIFFPELTGKEESP